MKVCVLGLGRVGLPAAEYLIEKGLDVWGYDIDSEAVDRAKKMTISKASRVWDDIPPMDVYLICVTTQLRGEDPDLSPVLDVCEKIRQKVVSPSRPLVSIESTVIPGLSRRVFVDVFNKRVRLVHVPERYWVEQPDEHGIKQKRVIGGVDAESLESGLKFYRDGLGIPLHVVSSVEAAEMSKIAENAYRYVQIALAEELRMICGETGLDFEDVRKACNTKWNIDIMEARDGIDGHCLPKDIRYVVSLTPFDGLLRSAMKVDKQYREWLKRETPHGH